MTAYTTALEQLLYDISWDDDNFMEELHDVAQLFRPFSQAMDDFICVHGYGGDVADVDEKVAFIRDAFAKAHMTAPREIREWFTMGQAIKRETAFQICFAFGLDGAETDDFFQRYYARERSFNCHQVREAVYYFCLNNHLPFDRAQHIQSRVPRDDKADKGGETVYTGTILARLNNMQTEEELIAYLTDNIGLFSASNVTAYDRIRRLWAQIAGPEGYLLKADKKLPSLRDDAVWGKEVRLRSGEQGVRIWEAYLAIFQLNKEEVKELKTDRSLKPLLQKLPAGVQDSFPDRQGIDKILRGEVVSHERVRKLLVLLTFYDFWIQLALKRGDYTATHGDAKRCFCTMNQMMIESGYPELYVGNPYDWLFYYTGMDNEPLRVFGFIVNELLAAAKEEHQ